MYQIERLKYSTYRCYGVIHGVVSEDAKKINVRAKPLILVKVQHLVDMNMYM